MSYDDLRECANNLISNCTRKCILLSNADEINYIYVDSDYRKQQIGTKLIEELISFAKINNCINITLEVNENNNVAINFYEKNGFKKSAIRNNYYGNENGILMIRELIK